MKVDKTVKRETVYIGLVTTALSMLMQAVFLVIGKWDYTVLLGNLAGIIIGVGNFFLMGLGVQAALDKEEKEAKNAIKASQRLRTALVLLFAALCAALPLFDTYAALIPILFPSIGVKLRPFIKRNEDVK